MSRYVTDTHALLWHLYNNPKLSQAAKVVFDRSDAGDDEIVIPAIVLVEIVYLTEKKRIPADAIQRNLALITSEADNYQIAPLDAAVAQAVQRVDRSVIPELPDRIIAATALELGLPLITREQWADKIDKLVVIW